VLGKIKKKLKLNRKGIIKKIEEENQKLDSPDTQQNSLFLPSSDALSNSVTTFLTNDSSTRNLIGLTILIEFLDVPATQTTEEIYNLLNQTGYTGFGNNGSIRDYFIDVSEGKFDYTNEITDYYTTIYPKQYYINQSNGRSLLVQEALQHFINQGFDFSNLTVDERGYIEGLNFFYTGEPEYNTNLHPRWSGIPAMEVADNIFAHYYMICNIGTDHMIIGTFIHESGHLVMGWGDIYDPNGGGVGVGNYCLMGCGNWLDDGRNPMVPNPYYRMLAGWENVIEITTETSGTQFIHDANSLTTYRYSHPVNTSEFFLIESRFRLERNSHIPDEGLIIWHIDQNGSNFYEQMTPEQHYKVSVEQADGRFDLEHNDNWGDDQDFFHAGDVTDFNDMTLPSSKWWNGDNSGLSISNISTAGPQMSFTAEYPNMFNIEAENSTYCSWINGTSIDNDNTGFSGTGFVNTPNQIGAWMECQVNISTGGMYAINVRYANESSAREATVSINGNDITNADFLSTGSWTTWAFETISNVFLNSGTNTIRLTATESGGLANIDRYDFSGIEGEYYHLSLETNGNGTIESSPSGEYFPYLTPITLKAVPEQGYEFVEWEGDLYGTDNPVTIELDCDQIIIANFISNTIRIQAEDQSKCSWISGTSIDDDHQGYTGDGYVNTPNETGAWTECEVTVPDDGNYQITVRYANGKSSTRTAQFIVNGTYIFNVDFYYTGGWSEWTEKYFMNIELQAGSNTICLSATTSGGLPNIDRYEIPQ
jgi:M6 family metalloprotease-like protein